jgi:hypothetical protein
MTFIGNAHGGEANSVLAITNLVVARHLLDFKMRAKRDYEGIILTSARACACKSTRVGARRPTRALY